MERGTTSGKTTKPATGWAAARRRVAVAVLAAVLGVALPAVTLRPLHAQGEEGDEQPGWFYTAEVSLVLTAGNAASNTVGAGAGLRRVWPDGRLELRASGLRTESSTTTRTAVGTPDDFQLQEETTTEVTAENYAARARYDRTLSGRTFVYGGSNWTRNTFAGVDSRWTVATGAGIRWLDRSSTRFRTDVGATFTVQNDVTENAAGSASRSFAGLRVSWDYVRRLTESTELSGALILDENLDETDDLRLDLTNALTLAINADLAFRTSLQLLFDNRPSLTSVPLVGPAGEPTGETVRVELDRLDSQLSFALVLDF